MTPPLNGILETAISVDNLERAAAFYRRVFQFPTLLESDRLVALNVAGRSILLLFQSGATSEPITFPGGTIPAHGTTGVHHFALSIPASTVDDWRQHLQQQSVDIESEVKWDGGAMSLYFRDPDNHVVELITPGFWAL
jgi:catechol 2,3-dioxygenase-like lactoylglutathione lyase family enzyme